MFKNYLIILWILAIFVYILKFFIPTWDEFTKYGKLDKNSKNKRFLFDMLYLNSKTSWILFYSFSVLNFIVILFLFEKSEIKIANLCLFFHSLRRLVESLYVTRFSERKIHIVNISAGLIFYFLTPMTMITSNNGINNDNAIFIYCIVFMLNILQFMCHLELSKLKKYTIPRSPLFYFTVTPHYIIEILLYLIYFVISFSFGTLLMFLFVFINLTHQIFLTYKWYYENFGEKFYKKYRLFYK